MLSFDEGPFANLLVPHLLMLFKVQEWLLMLLNLYNPSSFTMKKRDKANECV